MRNAFVMILGLALPFTAEAVAKAFSSKGPSCTFEQFLGNFVRDRKAASSANLFLVAEKATHPENEYWVYWPQARKLLLVSWPTSACKAPESALRKELDLAKDVVTSQQEVGSSTYLVTEDWVKTVLLDAANGYQVEIRKGNK